MNKKIWFCFAFFFFKICLAASQQDHSYPEGISKLNTWLSTIEIIISNIIEKEKLSRIYRQLGYAANDMDNIALGKNILAKEILNLSDLNPNQQLRRHEVQINQIIEDINKLLNNLQALKNDLSNHDQSVISEVIQTIRTGLSERKLHYLNDLKDYLYGKDISLNKIKEEAIQAKNIAEEASKKIHDAKALINKKLNN